MTNTWNNDAQSAVWYGCLIIERPDGETDYVYDFSGDLENAPDVDELLPEGCKILERELNLTPHGRHHMWINGDVWAFEEQKGDSYVSYAEYCDDMTV
jgi:hypothetical protein